MDHKVIPLHSESYTIAIRELKTIEQTLCNPISPQLCAKVFSILSTHIRMLEKIKKNKNYSKTPMQRATIEELEQKIISLFGQAIGKKIDFQVQRIENKTEKLKKSLFTNQSTDSVYKQRAVLAKEVKNLLFDHRISQEQMRVVDSANQVIALATTPPLTTRKEKSDTLYEHSSEEAKELFRLASFVYKNQIDKAKKAYQNLPMKTQNRIQYQCQRDEILLFSHRMKSLAAIFSVALQLCGCGEKILSEQELHDFFSHDE